MSSPSLRWWNLSIQFSFSRACCLRDSGRHSDLREHGNSLLFFCGSERKFPLSDVERLHLGDMDRLE